MSVICPLDGIACLDDLCNGAQECMGGGGMTLERCDNCGQTFDSDYVGAVANLCPDCNGEDEGWLDEEELHR